LNARTGTTLWTLPQVDVCGLSTTQMLVSVNGQTAVIDLASGQQLSYSAPRTAEDGSTAGQCPQMLSGGIGISDSASRLVITQMLTP
jgi:hypothetical protein